MSIRNRIRKLESINSAKPPCYCGGVFGDLWRGKPVPPNLAPCPNCRERCDFWEDLARDAATSANLTDAGGR